VLELQAVSLKKGNKYLLNTLNVRIQPGELTIILGPNGAGKSTLLNCMTGAEPDYHGCIQFEGKALRDWSIGELSKRRAVLSQLSAITFSFSVLEVVQMGIQNDAILEDSRAVCLDALDQMGVISLANTSYPLLSGGERQRVQIARTLVQLATSEDSLTKYLFLDEPTSALDLHHQLALMKKLKRLANNGMAIVCVLHDLQLASQYADKIILLKQGELVGIGDASTQLTELTIESLYHVPNHVIAHPTSGRPMVLLK
jgi:iron complex transport system ATP-binding protein